MYYSLPFFMSAVSIVIASQTGDNPSTPGSLTTPAPTEWCAEGDWTLCCKGELPDNPTTDTIPECVPVTTKEECPADPTDNWDSDENKMYCCTIYNLPETPAEKGTGDSCMPVIPQPNWAPDPGPAHDHLGAPSYIKGAATVGAGTALNTFGKTVGGLLQGGAENLGGLLQGGAANIGGLFKNLGNFINIGH